MGISALHLAHYLGLEVLGDAGNFQGLSSTTVHTSCVYKAREERPGKKDLRMSYIFMAVLYFYVSFYLAS